MLPEILNRVNNERPQNSEVRWKKSADICTNWLLKTIQDAPDRDVALIIGAGQTDDFQLNKIVKEFNTTFLLDIDEKSIQIAFNKLSPSEKAKVELITCDITGMTEESNQLIQTLRKNNITQSEIFKAIESYRNKLPYQFKPVAKIPTCSWIFSNCITTQLFSPFVVYSLGNNILNQENQNLLAECNVRMLRPFLRFVRNSLKRNGIFAFASDVFEINSYTQNLFLKNTGLSIIDIANSPLLIVQLTNSISALAGYNAWSAIYKHNINLMAFGDPSSWLWDFSEEKQYIVLADHFCKN